MCCRGQKIAPDDPVLLGGQEFERQAQQLLGQFSSVVRPVRADRDTAFVNAERVTRNHGTAKPGMFRRVSSLKLLGEPMPGQNFCRVTASKSCSFCSPASCCVPSCYAHPAYLLFSCNGLIIAHHGCIRGEIRPANPDPEREPNG